MVYSLIYQTSWKVYYTVGVFARHVSVKHICYVPQHMRYKTSATERLTKFTETARRVLLQLVPTYSCIIGTIKYYKFITAKIIILIHNSTGLHRAVHRDINLTVHLYLLIVTAYQKRLSGTIINSLPRPLCCVTNPAGSHTVVSIMQIVLNTYFIPFIRYRMSILI